MTTSQGKKVMEMMRALNLNFSDNFLTPDDACAEARKAPLDAQDGNLK